MRKVEEGGIVDRRKVAGDKIEYMRKGQEMRYEEGGMR